MANTVSNYLHINGTDEVQNKIDELFLKAGGYAETNLFVNSFYNTEYESGVPYEWLYDNVGTKWIYVENEIDIGRWNISSANYTPTEFWIHLHKLAVEIDPNVRIEVQYHDEGYEPIGAFIINKDSDKITQYANVEKYDITELLEEDEEGWGFNYIDVEPHIDECMYDAESIIKTNKGTKITQ